MSGGTAHAEQPATFAFSPENLAWAQRVIAKYPPSRQASAVLPLLDRAQRQHRNWLPRAAMDYVAGLLDMAPIRVYEVATFYTMFNLEPVGKYHFQVCGTTPCMLRGAERLKDFCERKIGPKGHVSGSGKFSWVEVECLGACVNAPMIQINDYYYEDLTIETLEKIIDDFAAGREPAPGTYVKRQTSAPEGPATSLTDDTLFDGSRAKPLAAIPNAPKPPEPAQT
jgi:NADH-quinone oxidoreductase subunit E